MKIKVCGLKCIDNIKKVTECGVDFVGLIFYEKSPRFVNGALSINEAQAIQRKKVGVFVNEKVNSVLDTTAKYNLDFVQLHGNESPEYCSQVNSHVKIIKAFGIDINFDFEILKSYKDDIDYFLFDTASKNYGGSGKSFDYDLLNKYNLEVPFFISGGISLENIQTIKQLKFKHLFGVDVNSKFETSPGLKNINEIKQLINFLK